MTNLLAVQTGRLPLAYDASENGQQQYSAAAKAAMLQGYAPMVSIIEKALKASKKHS